MPETLSRRAALLSLISAALSGTLLTAPSQPAAAATPHEVAIALARAVLDADRQVNRLRDAQAAPEVIRAARDTLNAAMNTLLGQMLDSFPGEVADADVREIMRLGHRLDVIDPARLAALADQLIPVAVLREVCFRHKVQVDCPRVPHLVTFMKRYKASIQAAIALPA